MSLKVIVFLPVFTFAQTTNLDYRLGWSAEGLSVDLYYRPLQADSTSFTYGVLEFGGQRDIFRGIKDLRADAPARLVPDTAHRRMTVWYGRDSTVHIHYLVVDSRTADNTRNQLFRPMLTSDYFFVHGLNLFLKPVTCVNDRAINVAISWQQPPPFPFFFSFDPDNDGTHPSLTSFDSIFYRPITGAADLLIKKFSAASGQNYLVLRSTGLGAATQDAIAAFYLSYNAKMRAFWRDKRVIRYSLILQPFINVRHDMSGISFGNGFIGKYTAPDSLIIGERRLVLAHEIGHYYLSGIKGHAGDNNEGQWFDEGFNDYCTWFNLVSAGMMKADEFTKVVNDVFHHLYNSPIRNTPNNKIFENFWLLGDYSKLPYWRGSVFAFYLDNRISRATAGRYSLRDCMLDLQELVRDRSNNEFSDDEFIQVVDRYLGEGTTASIFREYITGGASIPFTKDALLPFFELRGDSSIEPVLTINAEKPFYRHFQFKH